MASNDYNWVDYPEPHIGRTRQIMAAHPEVRELFGPVRTTAIWILLVVIGQILAATFLSHWQVGFVWVLVASFFVGAVANHSLFVMIHECTHNLVFRSSSANMLMGIVTNLPIVFPSAIGFRKFHLLHHRYQGIFEYDADLAGPVEAKLVGNSAPRKVLWLLFFFFVEGIVRPARLKNVKLMDRWVVLNIAVELAFLAGMYAIAGWTGLLYLTLSTMFSIGLHPLGARWIQEHYVIKPGQETYSYYGPFNKVMFNVGFHNEHHDLMMVPWMKLPLLREAASEFYDPLYSHRSYTALLLKFIFDPSMSLYSRVVRKSDVDRKAVPVAASNGAGIKPSSALSPEPA